MPPTALRHDGTADIETAIGALAETLPPALAPLAQLTFNYRWVWTPDGADVFQSIDPLMWSRCECNPRFQVVTAPLRRLQELAADDGYLRRLASAVSVLEAETSWPPMRSAATPENPLAYFCSEFAVHCSLPLYGGGLGVLAGDFLKAASDLGVPTVGVGLFYRQGYFRQRLDASGWQYEYWTPNHFELMPVVLVSAADGSPLVVDVPYRSRRVRLQVWRLDLGRSRLYLLDADRSDNEPMDRWITSRLYVGDPLMRLAQYLALGVGGTRALAAMGIEPAIVHLNEGHAAFAGYERVGAALRDGVDFEEALERARRTSVFTTHTPVAAGNESYPRSDIEPVLTDVFGELGLETDKALALGSPLSDPSPDAIGITPLALRTTRAANAVAKRHGEVSREMWAPLFLGREGSDVPIDHVTNGVHIGTWMAAPIRRLLDRYLGPAWCDEPPESGLWHKIEQIPDAELWEARCELRRKLVSYAREVSVHDRLSRGDTQEYVRAAEAAFKPEALTIGFARRVATYKRLYLLTQLPLDRLLPMLRDESRPLQLVVAGKAHPRDEEAKRALQMAFNVKQFPEVGRRVVYLEDYDMHMAPRIVAGVDLWLNLPRPPLEASGTSGMKVAMNGGLNLSVLDGWWVEGYTPEVGWAIQTPDADPGAQDAHDAAVLLDLLENEVLPLYYDRNAEGLPIRWLHRVKAAMTRLIPMFSARRMLVDYTTKMYGGRG